MAQESDSAIAESRPAPAGVPLSERPLVADDENTVISLPDKKPTEQLVIESSVLAESLRQRLFPVNGNSGGEESGIRLAHFEIRERIGAGGMGAVFRATDLELARDVALKILHPTLSADASLIARFRNEARSCAQLNHDNIARVFYAGSQDGLHFIAYELADGSTIKDLISQQGHLSPGETINYAIQVTLALNHIAAAGIVHRDIKPSNIMLTTIGRVKVVDLGLARRDVTDSIGDITVAGTTLGTFDYIAPEQARDPRHADIRSDIYSLGCTMYHMLAGQPPYPEGTALQKLLDHQGKSPPDPRSINAEITPELAAIMRKMMANSPEHRYQAPALLLSDLLHVAHLLGLQSIPAEGIVWRKIDGLLPRQPVGALWMFGSVVVICLTAIVLQQSPQVQDRSVARTRESEATLGVPDPGVPESGRAADGTVPEVRQADLLTSSGAPISPTPSDTEKSVPTGPPGSPATRTAANDSVSSAANGVSPAGLTALPVPVPMISFGVLSPAVLEIDVPVAGGQGGMPITATESPASGPFVVQKASGSVVSFRTLQGAVADAKSGDVILLRYNGYPSDIPAQPPVRIVGMNLIIRAAEGFRPTLEFDGGRNQGVAVSPTDMFTLNRGTLTIRDVDLRLRTREELTADRWTMFRLDGPNRLQLENVTLDCVNPTAESVFLVDLVDGSSTPEDSANAETSVSFNRVTCRGEADGFRIAGQPQGKIVVQNSALALKGSLVQDLGSASMLQVRGELELWMEHVTVLLSGALIHMRDSDELTGRGSQRVLPNLTVRTEACVFASMTPNGRLIVSEGNSYIEDIESALTWNGFTNLYHQFSVYWQIETAALDYTTRRMDAAQWRLFWQNRTDSEETNPMQLNDSAWIESPWTADPAFPMTSLRVASLQLNPRLFPPDGGTVPFARDGLIPGAAITQLPEFPISVRPDPVATTPSVAAVSGVLTGSGADAPKSNGPAAPAGPVSDPDAGNAKGSVTGNQP